MAERAVIFVQYDKPHPDKQQVLAFARAEEQRLRIVSLSGSAADCVALVEAGAVEVVVAAIPLPDHVASQIEAAHGRVEVVRAGPPARMRRDVSALVARMAAKGMTPDLIAEVLSVPVRDVQQTIGGLNSPATRSREASGSRDTRRKL